jgi:hypothetical protein
LDDDFLERYEKGAFPWTPKQALDHLAQVARWCQDNAGKHAEIATEAVMLAAQIISSEVPSDMLESIILLSHSMTAEVCQLSEDKLVRQAGSAFLKGAEAAERIRLTIDVEDTIGPVMGRC